VVPIKRGPYGKRAKTLIVIAALALLLLFGLYERRAYCNSGASFARVERDGAISERQSFLCVAFSRD
jgi:hypothetical protein